MGKSPLVYSGNERSRHYNYSRNNQSRNRRSENQGFGPDNYIYTPDPYLSQLPPSRRVNKHVGRGSSQQYFRERSFRKRPQSANRGRPIFVQQRITPRRKCQRPNMHPPEELEAATDATELSTLSKTENASTFQSKKMEEGQENEASQTSVPQTRSTAKSQQNKFEETGSPEKSVIEDGDRKVQNSQTSTSNDDGKTEEPEKGEDGNKVTRNTRGSNKSLQSKLDNTLPKELFETAPVSISPTKSVNKLQNKLAESNIQKTDDSDKVIHRTRGNKSVSDEKASTTTEIPAVEEKTGGHNTRSAAKTKLDTNDKTECQEETENVSRSSQLDMETKTVATHDYVGTNNKSEQDAEIIVIDDTASVTSKESFDNDEHCTKDICISVLQEIDNSTDKVSTAVESKTEVEKEGTNISPNTKKVIGGRSPKLILPRLDTPVEKIKELSPEKPETLTLLDKSDGTRRSSRRSSSKTKAEETLFLHKRRLRGHSGTPVEILPEIEQKDHSNTAASIRSISCRRPIRDSPNSSLNDSFHKRRTLMAPQVQLTVKTTRDFSDSKHDLTVRKTLDMSAQLDDKSPPKEKSGKRKLSPLDDTSPPKEKSGKIKLTPLVDTIQLQEHPGKKTLTPLGDSFPPQGKPGKRKFSPLETTQEHKKICTLKTTKSSSVFSDVCSPLQKQEHVSSSSTPFKVVEYFEDVHMEVSEENISEESLEFEKTGDISDQSVKFPRETHLVKETIVDESLLYGKGGDISGQSTAVESETSVGDHSNEQTARKWCSVM